MLDTDISSNQRRRQSESEFVDSKARSDEIPRDGVAEVGPEAAISARAGLRVADGGTAQQSCHLSFVKPKTGPIKGAHPTQACAAASRETCGPCVDHAVLSPQLSKPHETGLFTAASATCGKASHKTDVKGMEVGAMQGNVDQERLAQHGGHDDQAISVDEHSTITS